jgi:hypothetical protein
MNTIKMSEVAEYVNLHINVFHQSRLNILSKLTLKQLITKNPYLFRAKNISIASELICSTLDAFLSSSEEKLFGDFLEDLAVFIASKTTGGYKSSAPGLDLEFENDGAHYLVSIKSGPNWGNSSQHKKLVQDFNEAERRLKQSLHVMNVYKVLGICYGKTPTKITSKGYYKIVGQNFGALISNNENLYTEIIEPVGFRAKEHNDQFYEKKGNIINCLTAQFIQEFCDSSGVINWQKLVRYVSGNYDLNHTIYS